MKDCRSDPGVGVCHAARVVSRSRAVGKDLRRVTEIRT